MDPTVQAWFWEVRDGEADTFLPVLSSDEKKRAARLFRPVDRERWIVARGRTRQLLGTMIGADPAAIAFGLVENGRPFILGDGYVAPSFNVSHTDKYGLLAVSGEFQIGVDIEAVRPIEDNEIAWALSQAERDQLERVDPAARLETFFRFWTLKEAFMKGTGLGASLPLHDFDIGLEGPKLLRVAGKPGEPGRWHFAETVPACGVRTAITGLTEGQPFTVHWHALR